MKAMTEEATAMSILDDDLGVVVDPDGDTSTDDDLCARCGRPRFEHRSTEPDECPFYEVD